MRKNREALGVARTNARVRGTVCVCCNHNRHYRGQILD